MQKWIQSPLERKVNKMRIKHKPEPMISDERVITKFLLFPKRIGDEERWLERATFRQEYVEGYNNGRFWIDISWV